MTQSAPDRILVVDDDADIARFVQIYLEGEGFAVLTAGDGETALRVIAEHRPDLALIDVMMPGLDGVELTRRLRGAPSTSSIPIIMLTAKTMTVDKVVGLTAGADDFVVKPFDTMELVARIRSILRRNKEFRESSPLTGLPGNTRIVQEIAARLARQVDFAVGHVDIDRFKTVNDVYGFGRGDRFIAALSKALEDSIAVDDEQPPFLGHIGGDDFVIVCHPDQIRGLTEGAVAAFEAAADSLYDPIDSERGYVEKVNRRGEVQRAGLVTISIGFALSSNRRYTSPQEIISAASEMKTVAKSQPGSYVAIDRRRPKKDDKPWVPPPRLFEPHGGVPVEPQPPGRGTRRATDVPGTEDETGSPADRTTDAPSGWSVPSARTGTADDDTP